jgi:hypothetical protein
VKHAATLLFASLLTLAGLPACQVDLPIASKIERMRVLTAITTVDGDEARSTPKPGENARVTWVMAYPDAEQDDSQLRSLFYTCTAPSNFSGTPVCQELVDLALAASQGGASNLEGLAAGAGIQPPDCAAEPDSVLELGPIRIACMTGTPIVDIRVPDTFKADAQLMQGVICRNGTPTFELAVQPRLVCKPDGDGADSEEIAVTGTVPVQYDADTTNINPSSDALGLKFHSSKVDWEVSDEVLQDELSDEACAALAQEGRVMSSEGQEEDILITYAADEREQFAGKPEPLTLSAYCTFGELSNRFTVFRSDAKTPLERKITWELSDEESEQLKKSSKYVRFYFTVQDGRGGFAVTRRDLCVVR